MKELTVSYPRFEHFSYKCESKFSANKIEGDRYKIRLKKRFKHQNRLANGALISKHGAITAKYRLILMSQLNNFKFINHVFKV